MAIYVPNKYDDDGTISKEYLAYEDALENFDTNEERWREQKIDDGISYFKSEWANGTAFVRNGGSK